MFKSVKIGKKDMDGTDIREGHIIAVRYVWNSYVGVIRYVQSGFKLSLHESKEHGGFAPFHDIDNKGTYQVLGHIEESDSDYSEIILKWFKNGNGKCPVHIKIYETEDWLKAVADAKKSLSK